jgi:hypothetical protein
VAKTKDQVFSEFGTTVIRGDGEFRFNNTTSISIELAGGVVVELHTRDNKLLVTSMGPKIVKSEIVANNTNIELTFGMG